MVGQNRHEASLLIAWSENSVIVSVAFRRDLELDFFPFGSRQWSGLPARISILV